MIKIRTTPAICGERTYNPLDSLTVLERSRNTKGVNILTVWHLPGGRTSRKCDKLSQQGLVHPSSKHGRTKDLGVGPKDERSAGREASSDRGDSLSGKSYPRWRLRVLPSSRTAS